MEPSRSGPLPHSIRAKTEELVGLSTDLSISVGSLVQHAKVLAARVPDPEMAKWLDLQLNGYPPGPNPDHPDWRRVGGPLRGQNPHHGWVPLDFQDNADLEEAVPTTLPLTLSVAEIEKHLEAANGPMVEIPPLTKMCGVLVVMMLQKPQLVRVLTAIRSRVTDWALSLEARGFLPVPAPATLEVDREILVPLQVSVTHAMLALRAQIASGERLATDLTATAFEGWDTNSSSIVREICLDHAVAEDYEKDERWWRPIDEPPGWAEEQLRKKLLVRLGRLRTLANKIELARPQPSIAATRTPPANESPEDLVHLTPAALFKRLKLKHWWVVLGTFITYTGSLVGGAWWVRGQFDERDERDAGSEVVPSRGGENTIGHDRRPFDAGIADASVPTETD